MTEYKWTFKTIRLTSDGTIETVNLVSYAQQTKKFKYNQALEKAAQSAVPRPIFSNYFVKESIGYAHGYMLRAGNFEYGFCQALHGEESAIAAFRSHYGRKELKQIVLGIIAGAPGNIATPCGNCRDIMLEDLGENFEIVSGAASGGIAIVTTMQDYLFSDFKAQDIQNTSEFVLKKIKTAVLRGKGLVNDAYSPKHIHPERKYHALLVTGKNEFAGAHDIMCEYHPIYALRDAIRQARRANDPFIEFVFIVCEDVGGKPPHVMYKDRQHLLELNLQAELVAGKEDNPPIFLATHQNNGQIVNIWKTSVKEWIPLAFTPRNFGPEFVKHLTNYFKSCGQ